MNIIINQNKLRSAINSVERVVSKNISLPILNTILLKTEGGRVRLTATNLEVGIHVTLGAKIEAEGSIAVPARVFSEFVGNIQDEKITLNTEGNVLLVNSEHYQTKILSMGAEDFPLIPTLHNAIEFKIDALIIKQAIGSVLDATSLLETRPELTGVFVSVGNNSVIFAATDSFRLSEFIAPISTSIEKSFIIPRTTALEILRLASEHAGEMTIAIAENQIAARGDDFELVSRLIDGRYPEYRKIIPEKYIEEITIEKQELERGVRMASIFSSSISDLLMKISKEQLALTAKNSDRGEINAQLLCSGAKSAFDVSVNYRYLLDGLKVTPGNKIILGYTGPGSPLVLMSAEQKNQVYVIMPLRT